MSTETTCGSPGKADGSGAGLVKLGILRVEQTEVAPAAGLELEPGGGGGWWSPPGEGGGGRCVCLIG